MKDTKAVIFDLDNTLVDFQAAVGRASEYVEEVGLDSAQFLAATHSLWDRFVDGEMSWRAAEFQRWVLVGAKPDLVAEYNHRYERILRDCPLLPGVETMLSRLMAQGVQLGLLTNGPADGQREKIANRGLAEFFRYVGIAEETGHFKPDGEAFRLASSRLGVDLRSCLMVGDSLFHDAQGAIRAGYGRAIWFHAEEQTASGEMKGIIEARSISRLKECLLGQAEQSDGG